jgi:hypothetical protein
LNSPKALKEYYSKYLQGTSVINKDLNLRIHFTSIGKGKLAFGGSKSIRKAAIIQCLSEVLEVAEFNNFGRRKEKDSKIVIGYLNFKAKVKVDEKIENIRIAVLIKTDGKVYYSHEINKKRTLTHEDWIPTLSEKSAVQQGSITKIRKK